MFQHHHTCLPLLHQPQLHHHHPQPSAALLLLPHHLHQDHLQPLPHLHPWEDHPHRLSQVEVLVVVLFWIKSKEVRNYEYI